jgi:hypothetical protein
MSRTSFRIENADSTCWQIKHECGELWVTSALRWKEKTMQKQSKRHRREEDRKIIYRMKKAGKRSRKLLMYWE